MSLIPRWQESRVQYENSQAESTQPWRNSFGEKSQHHRSLIVTDKKNYHELNVCVPTKIPILSLHAQREG